MSSRVIVKSCSDEASGVTAYLREECLAVDSSPVYLELSGLSNVVVEVSANRTCVTMELPRHLAENLGLLPSSSEPAEVAPYSQDPPGDRK